MRGRIFIFLLQIEPILESEFLTRRSNITIDKNAFTEVDMVGNCCTPAAKAIDWFGRVTRSYEKT